MDHNRATSSHEERTAEQARGDLFGVVVSRITRINEDIRNIKLQPIDPTRAIDFLPGQWLDVFVPGLERAGGFTITSTPRLATSTKHKPALLELAVQNTRNPPARWLWKPESDIMAQQLQVRVGGNFTWPPPHLDTKRIKRIVFVAGGVGINPLISIFKHLIETKYEGLDEMVFLYSTKAGRRPIDGHEILFLSRLQKLVNRAEKTTARLETFLTHTTQKEIDEATAVPASASPQRITKADLEAALGDLAGREGTICYVCGPPQMTDSFVEQLSNADGMHADRVLCEKWW